MSRTIRFTHVIFCLLHAAVHAFIMTYPTRVLVIKSRTRLMGIQGFRGWLESQFPGAITYLTDTNKGQHSETFDHVLIDLNQLLHICVRKSRSDGHALVLLMKELDAVVALATPKISLVIAMDGPPPAAKLATQRSRRYNLLRKAEWRRNNIHKIKYLSKKQIAYKLQRAESAIKTLRITPGTEFMTRAKDAVMYWAWQRLDSRTSDLAKNKVSIYISPSTVPGEGEVKLLAWIYDHQQRHNQESVAIYGGDSDLVLEALIVPTTVTHNIFVLLPDGNKRVYAVNLWEITLNLMFKLPKHNIVHLRTDLVLLLILNGNDYLPKLRGSSGFHKLFQTYIALQRASPGSLVDPDTLEFNMTFAIQFFEKLAESVPESSYDFLRRQPKFKEEVNASPLSLLNNYVNAGYLPGPLEFHMARTTDASIAWDELMRMTEHQFEKSNVTEDLVEDLIIGADCDDGGMLVQLRLGKPSSDDYYVVDTWKSDIREFKAAKQELAAMALRDLLDYEENLTIADDTDLSEMPRQGYDWEVRSAESSVNDYLYGLLWNLQTYQDGVCADYAFNYGKKLSPTAAEIATFLRAASDVEATVGMASLAHHSFSPAMTAGVSCLAALPAAMKHLVPEPYRLISDEDVEHHYASCVSKVDNVFDSTRFQKLCDEEIARIQHDGRERSGKSTISDTGGWTVISKANRPLSSPFEPPAPFSDKLSRLPANNWLRIRYLHQLERPRQRFNWRSNKESKGQIVHSKLVPFMETIDSLKNVRYKKAYAEITSRRRSLSEDNNIDTDLVNNKEKEVGQTDDSSRQVHMRLENMPSSVQYQLSDGTSAVACLRQLMDVGFVYCIEWQVLPDLIDPGMYETVELVLTTAKGNATFACDRKVNAVPRKSVKQYIASCALAQLTGLGKDWSTRSFREVKDSMLL